MGGTNIMTVYNANVYMNKVSYAGVAGEATLPDLKPKEADQKPLSGIGGFKLPVGLDEMGMKIKWNSLHPDVLALLADFYTSIDIMIRGNVDYWRGGTRYASAPIVAQVRGLSQMAPPIGFKHQDNAEIESQFNVTAYSLSIAGRQLWDVDIMSQVYIVDGVDKLAEYRANLGL